VCKLKPAGLIRQGAIAPAPNTAVKVPARQGGPPANLAECLRSSVKEVHLPDSHEFEQAKQCRNRRSDITVHGGSDWANPLAVVRAKSVEDVQGAVRCVAAAQVDTCARAGAHGFENDACCPGGVIIDVQDLLWFSVDHQSDVASFGSGYTLGALYYMLAQQQLVVPGGTEGHVGASGLILGCGRGMMTQYLGLICDTIVGLEYVDSDGNLQTANEREKTDMLWIAKGGGGNFPGIVVTYHLQASPMPKTVFGRYCHIPNDRSTRFLLAWSNRADDLADPSRSMFSHVTTFSKVDGWFFDNLCFDCDGHQMDKFHTIINEILGASGGANCHEFSKTWLNKLLSEPGINAENNPEALLDNGRWPTNHAQSINGCYMMPWHGVDERAVAEKLKEFFKDRPPSGGAYTGQVYLYLMGGPKITNIRKEDTAYGNRDAKFTVHWRFFNANSGDVRWHHKQFTQELDRLLPCKSFYNYMGEDMTCNHGDREQWLSQFFSNVPRMKAIKRREDPDVVFRNRLVLPPPKTNCGRGETCGRAMHNIADGHSCGSRIKWYVEGFNSWMPMNELAACNVVANDFPGPCGACRPTHLPTI